MVQALERTEPCPDCGGPLAITPARQKRGRTRCRRCWLDLKLESTDVGDGPERTSAYLELLAPSLSPPARLKTERGASRLSITLAPDTNIGLAMGGLAIGAAVVLLAAFGALSTLTAALLFVPVLAGGFILASREQTRWALVVERGVVRINGARIDGAIAGEHVEPLGLAPREQQWLREVVAARVAGDLDPD